MLNFASFSDNFARMTRWIVKLSGIAFGNKVIDSEIASVAKFSTSRLHQISQVSLGRLFGLDLVGSRNASPRGNYQ